MDKLKYSLWGARGEIFQRLKNGAKSGIGGNDRAEEGIHKKPRDGRDEETNKQAPEHLFAFFDLTCRAAGRKDHDSGRKNSDGDNRQNKIGEGKFDDIIGEYDKIAHGAGFLTGISAGDESLRCR